MLGSEQVGSQAHFHAGALHYLEAGKSAVANAAQLFHADGREAQIFSLFGQRRERGHSWHGECAALSHEVRRLWVDQRGVFDGAHAQGYGPAHGFRRMTVRGDVGTRAGGLIDGGANLVVRILAALQRIGRGRDAARCHQLNVRCAAPQFFAYGAPHGVHAIGDYGEAVDMAAAAVIARPKVAMAAGLADGAAAVE